MPPERPNEKNKITSRQESQKNLSDGNPSMQTTSSPTQLGLSIECGEPATTKYYCARHAKQHQRTSDRSMRRVVRAKRCRMCRGPRGKNGTKQYCRPCADKQASYTATWRAGRSAKKDLTCYQMEKGDRAALLFACSYLIGRFKYIPSGDVLPPPFRLSDANEFPPVCAS